MPRVVRENIIVHGTITDGAGQRFLPGTQISPAQNVLSFGAHADGIQDDQPAIQAAIDAAAALGQAGLTGGTVIIPSGLYRINSPIVLPRTGSLTTANNVHLIGADSSGMLSTRIQTGVGFPINRGMIEWAATTERVAGCKIANLRLTTSGIAGVKCIWHKAQNSLVSVTQAMAEWFSCDFENLMLEGHCDYTPVLIDLEVGNRFSVMRNIVGDCGLGNGTYDPIVIRTASSYAAGVAPAIGADSVGFGFMRIEGVIANLRRGGYCVGFEGRIIRSTWDNGVAFGGRNTDCFKFVNSSTVTITNVGTEGLAERAGFRFVSCESMDLINCGVGTPDAANPIWQASHAYTLGQTVVATSMVGLTTATSFLRWVCTTAGTSGASEPAWPGSGTQADGTVVWTAGERAVGDGFVFESCTDMRIHGRWSPNNGARSSVRGSKIVTIDSSCKRVVCEDFGVRGPGTGDVSAEITNSGVHCKISGMDLSTIAAIPYATGSNVQSPSATKTWSPGAIGSGAAATTTITVTGAVVGDRAVAHLTTVTAVGWIISAYGTAADTVSVTLLNVTGGSLTPASGTLAVQVIR